MAYPSHIGARPVARTAHALQPAAGSIRTCLPYTNELARHRLITADGLDYIVATARSAAGKPRFVTGAYPVSRGYLVMLRQPLCEIRSDNEESAREEHEQLVRVLSEAGVAVVRARRMLAARRRAERAEAARSVGHVEGTRRASAPARAASIVPASAAPHLQPVAQPAAVPAHI